ncbi:MAG: DUF1905 domain-containing protein [Acidimicrobiales bacterium]|nr:DUF1905 domain-containing protein [Hyphomonadaceae bacterium]RZV40942.1 MAG: DUF1905 domain-containing protein [Acidimicrobiales bacterium]
MHDLSFTFSAKLWKWTGKGTWFFMTVPKEYADEIRFFAPDSKRGFGSVRVTASVGETVWKTSIFPSKSTGAYILPIKAEIRKNNALNDGSFAEVKIDIIV